MNRPCENVYKRKFIQKISEQRRNQIIEAFWKFEHEERRNFMLQCTSMSTTKQKTTPAGSQLRRSKTLFYFLKDDFGSIQNICKKFLF